MILVLTVLTQLGREYSKAIGRISMAVAYLTELILFRGSWLCGITHTWTVAHVRAIAGWGRAREYFLFTSQSLRSRPRNSVQPYNTRNIDIYINHSPAKQPFEERALVLRTGLMDSKLQGLNRLLFRLSPLVARANIIKFPSSPPGEHSSGSC